MSTTIPETDDDTDGEGDNTTAPTERERPTDAVSPEHESDDLADASGPTRAELVARIDLLEAENNHLRSEYGRVRQSQYRRRALGLAGIGLVAIGGAFVFTTVRDVLIVLGATGLFAALLTYYLVPETFVAADIGDRVYAALARNQERIAAALGLGDQRLYMPTPDRSTVCRLFVPRYQEYQLPEEHDADDPIITEENGRGLVLEPTGARLFEEFERALTTEIGDTPSLLSTQLADALVEQFELVGRVDPAVDPGRVTFAITDSAFGSIDRFDHPIASFLAVGLAVGLDESITLEVTAGDERADWLVTCRWETDTASESTTGDLAVETDTKDKAETVTDA